MFYVVNGAVRFVNLEPLQRKIWNEISIPHIPYGYGETLKT